MGIYVDRALAAYAAREQAELDAKAAERQALIDAAKSVAAPLWTDAFGKPFIDPLKMVRAETVDEANRLVILSVLDDKDPTAVDVSFAVSPDKDEKRVVTPTDRGEWTGLNSPLVKDLDDVGAVLAGDA